LLFGIESRGQWVVRDTLEALYRKERGVSVEDGLLGSPVACRMLLQGIFFLALVFIKEPLHSVVANGTLEDQYVSRR
jgi:hypothetical protein